MATALGDAVGFNSNGTGLVNFPATSAAGDLAVVGVVWNHNAAAITITPPAGWTESGTQTTYSSSMAVRKFYRKLTSGDISTGSATWTCSSSAQKWSIAIGVLKGVDADTAPTLAVSSTGSTRTTHPISPATFTSKTGVSIGMIFQRGSALDGSFSATPSGYTVIDQQWHTSTGATMAAVASNMTDDADGSVGSGDFTTATAQASVTLNWVAEVASTGFSGSVALSGSGTLAVTGVAETPGVVNLTGSGTLTVTGGPSVTGAVALGGTGTLAVTSDTPVDLLTYPIYIAHRGGPNITDRAENTVTAYALSIANDHPAMLLETDCAGLATGGGYTAEQRIALTHEGDDLSTNSRTVQSDGTTVVTGTSITKTVAQWDSYLITQRSGISGTPKPASRWYTGDSGNPGLADLLLANPTKIAVPEVKEPEALTPLIDSITDLNLAGRTIVQSFDYTEAQTIAAAGLNALYLVSAFTSPTASAIYASGIRFVGIDRTNASLASLTTTAHAAGLKVIAYTVNSDANRITALAAGVDGMFTDRPDLVNAGAYGTVNLTGSGTLTVSGAPGVSRTVALSGTGTLGVTATPSASQTVNLTGSGTLAVTGEASGSGMGTVQLGGTGTLGVSGVPSFTGAVSLEGTGTLTVAAIVAVAQAVNLAGSGELTVAGTAGGAARNLTFAGRVSQRISIVGRVED